MTDQTKDKDDDSGATAVRRDDVIKRMLNTPPAPRKVKPKVKKPRKKATPKR